jgi:5-methyltetrahydropteroyltriglutamate--homocysteine methyltransferase
MQMRAPYRADHVGSLLRPPEVLEAQQALREGRTTAEAVRAIEDRAILDALELQRKAGLDVYSDGEFRRRAWASDFAEAVDGYVDGSAPVALAWSGGRQATATAAQPAVTGRVIGERLRQRRRLTAHESSFLKQHAPGPFKITMPAPSYIAARGYKPGITDRVYAGRAELLADIVAIVRSEIAALVEEGVPYVQLDNPHYPDYIDAARREQWRALGIDPDAALAEDIAADNAALEGIDRSRVTIGLHICRGNSRSAWHTAGSYDRIAEQVFGGIAADRFLLEYDSERAGGFEPLRFVPEDRIVVLGLITTKSGELESPAALRRRIEEASQYVPLERLALSPQCGFASVAEGNLITPEEQQRKLELVASTARAVWG